jgi:hypothetical protein
LIDKELVEFFIGAETISKVYSFFFDFFNKESLFYTNVAMQISSMLISALFFVITFSKITQLFYILMLKNPLFHEKLKSLPSLFFLDKSLINFLS